jgi:predicted Zn finger-like uncharacterized protein
MSVHIECPFCKTRLRLPEGAAGRAIRCPRCSTAVRIPAPATPAGGTPRPGQPPRN